MDLDEVREEFRAGWREGAERGGIRDEAHRLSAWTRRLPAGLARFALGQLRALWTVTVALLRDALRGTPVLVGILARGLARGVRAAIRASAGAGAAAPTPAPAPAAEPETKPKAPAAAEEGQEPAPVEAPPAAVALMGPPWKRRKAAAKAPAKHAPATPPAPARGGLADVLERFVIGFLALAVVATFGGMALGALGSVLAPYVGGIILVLVVAWLVAAAMVAPQPGQPVDQEDEGEDRAENDHAKSAGEEPREIDPWPILRAAIRNCVEQETATGAGGFKDAKGRGVRMDDLVAPLQRRGVAEAVDRKAVIDLLERAEITYREQMKFRVGGKQKNAPGVHVDDLANDLGYRPRLPAGLVPDLTPQPGPSRELRSRLG